MGHGAALIPEGSRSLSAARSRCGTGAAQTNIDPTAWFNALPHYVNARTYGSHYDGSNLTAEPGYPNKWIWHCSTRIAHDRKHSTSGLNAFHYGMNGVLNGTPSFGPDYGLGANGQKHTYALNITQPAQTIFMGEAINTPTVSPAYSGNTIDRQRHNRQSSNLLFMDGRVSLHQDTEIPMPEYIDELWRSDNPPLIWGPFKN